MGKTVGRKKELTKEGLQKQEYARELDHVKLRIANVNEPTYCFQVGEKVIYGAFKESVITEVLFGGKAYAMECLSERIKSGIEEKETCVRIAAWTEIRPIVVSETDFHKKGIRRPDFSTRTIEGLLHMYYFQGVHMDPEYQRGYVWDAFDKEYLIDTIFQNGSIGDFLFRKLPLDKNMKGLEIVDGKQRLSTLVEFYENRFPYQGVFYNELSGLDKAAFKNLLVSVGELPESISDLQTMEQFLRVNRGGRTIDREHLDKIQKIYEKKMKRNAL